MRIDSCRKCGMELEKSKECSICNNPIKFSCKKCHFESEEQIHSLCTIDVTNYRPQVSNVA